MSSESRNRDSSSTERSYYDAPTYFSTGPGRFHSVPDLEATRPNDMQKSLFSDRDSGYSTAYTPYEGTLAYPRSAHSGSEQLTYEHQSIYETPSAYEYLSKQEYDQFSGPSPHSSSAYDGNSSLMYWNPRKKADNVSSSANTPNSTLPPPSTQRTRVASVVAAVQDDSNILDDSSEDESRLTSFELSRHGSPPKTTPRVEQHLTIQSPPIMPSAHTVEVPRSLVRLEIEDQETEEEVRALNWLQRHPALIKYGLRVVIGIGTGLISTGLYEGLKKAAS
ncbi:hypothetical protein BDV96DRAFT_599279 [Lophiotrema nucula]|uniref:Uncharacterized protein n=1 Tax=Lophiotrema nucula TaxID=690887 RepID=A0A6A5Z922_9PLEO|nr:hypothetical protein BDV96DRAFT_599279 [Lophiotrema nucula]